MAEEIYLDKNLVVLDYTWRCGNIGIILLHNKKTNIQSGFINFLKYISYNRKDNLENIYRNGEPLTAEEAKGFFPEKINEKIYQYGRDCPSEF